MFLNSVNGLGPVKIKRLLEVFKKPQDVLEARENELAQIEGISSNIAASIKKAEKDFDIKKEFDLARIHNIKIISIFDKNYPENLKSIYDAPLYFYVKGELADSDNISLAVVGSRRASIYGLRSAEDISFELASKGLTIVSGLARGIDTAAHKGALKASGGRTIAVLGNGLAKIYPPENTDIAEKIIAGNGCIISECPISSPPDKINFPKRNRIISGLSMGVLVVEAAKRSGALITADFALNENREVFAMPGKVDSLTSQGTHALIKEGAKLVENGDDILMEFTDKISNYLKNSGTVIKKNPAPQLDKAENDVYKVLDKDEPLHIDEIVSRSNLNVNQTSGVLVKLQLKRLIKELPGKKYILN